MIDRSAIRALLRTVRSDVFERKVLRGVLQMERLEVCRFGGEGHGFLYT